MIVNTDHQVLSGASLWAADEKSVHGPLINIHHHKYAVKACPLTINGSSECCFFHVKISQHATVTRIDLSLCVIYSSTNSFVTFCC